MITGHVRRDEALIRIRAAGLIASCEIEAIVDTGFSASLTLPAETIRNLGLEWHSVGKSILADGSTCLSDRYYCEVIWDGQSRRIVIDEAETEPLVGMKLMRDHELRIAIRPGVKVSLRPLRS